MIIRMSPGASIEQLERVINRITQDYGLRCETIVSDTTVIGVKGIASVVDEGRILELPGVDRVIRITEKYKDASRSFHRDDSVIEIAPGVRAGGPHLTFFGGPCAIESEKQAIESAMMAKDAGVDVLRAFVDKSRTSPYDYRGLELQKGLEIAAAMKEATGLPTVSELIDLGNPPAPDCNKNGVGIFLFFLYGAGDDFRVEISDEPLLRCHNQIGNPGIIIGNERMTDT